MPEVAPFRALRYDFDRFGGDLSGVLAPPYDVLDKSDKDALLAKDEHNIVAVDLPHIPPKDEGPQQAYLDAQFNLESWTAQGILIQEETPAVYAYNQTFEIDGKKHTRHQIIVAARLHEFSEGLILPHEETFGGPKADRFALTKETRCNLSPIFSVYTDPENDVGKALAATTSGKPDAVANFDGVQHEMWVVTDGQAVQGVVNALINKNFYIADGHHRYTTALNYRQYLADMHGSALPPSHPANFVMMVLASMDDPGCVIQGYNRVLSGTGANLSALMEGWSEGIEAADDASADMQLYDGASKKKAGVRFTNRAILEDIASDHAPAWRELDVAYLHRYLIDTLSANANFKIDYAKSIELACKMAEEKGGVAVLPKATPMEQLRAVSEAGELMPQKSTFFYPKLATGLTIHRLYEE
ncbi:MAG TPA: DUF1015 domain-containing protein [Phycisphaerae bacterium]|nr:DUF1015 domain-containing protein [Phycisphaerae bacterium]